MTFYEQLNSTKKLSKSDIFETLQNNIPTSQEPVTLSYHDFMTMARFFYPEVTKSKKTPLAWLAGFLSKERSYNRYHTTYIYSNGKGILYATDGKRLASIPDTDNITEGYYDKNLNLILEQDINNPQPYPDVDPVFCIDHSGDCLCDHENFNEEFELLPTGNYMFKNNLLNGDFVRHIFTSKLIYSVQFTETGKDQVIFNNYDTETKAVIMPMRKD